MGVDEDILCIHFEGVPALKRSLDGFRVHSLSVYFRQAGRSA